MFKQKKSVLYLFMSLYLLSFDLGASYAPIDVKLDSHAHKIHQFDTLNILAYSILLIITVITIWVFKIRRFKYIHETGLAIFYGLIVGALIKYVCNQSTEFTYLRVVPSGLRQNCLSNNQTTNRFLEQNQNSSNFSTNQSTNELVISTNAQDLTNLLRSQSFQANGSELNISLSDYLIDAAKSNVSSKFDFIQISSSHNSKTKTILNDASQSTDESTTVASSNIQKTTIEFKNSTLEPTTQQARPSTENTLNSTLPLNTLIRKIRPTTSTLKNPKNQTNESNIKENLSTSKNEDSKSQQRANKSKELVIKSRPADKPVITSSTESIESDLSKSIKIEKLTAPPDSIFVNLGIEDKSLNTTSNKNYVYLFKGELVNHDVTDIYISQKSTFDPNFFFNVVIPLIVFEAGYSLKRRFFFHNLGAILVYSLFGTCISSLTVAFVLWTLMLLVPTAGFTFFDCLFFGAIISSTDTVAILGFFNHLNVDVSNVNLYALVLGESVLSDAVVIVLVRSIDLFEQDLASNQNTGSTNLVFCCLHAFKSFCSIFSLSVLIGFLIGILNALLTKFTKLKEFYLLESSLFVLMSYSAFLISELLELSGIVTILFCGIFQAHYNYDNLSSQSQEITKKFTELLSFLAENFIFTYLGVSMFMSAQHRWAISIIIFSFIAIIIGRFLNIYPLSFLLNLNRSNKIPFKYQTVLFFSGLRGSMAYALAIQQTITESRQIILTTTSCIIIITVILGGSLLSKLLDLLDIDRGLQESDQEMKPFSKNNDYPKNAIGNETKNLNLNKSFSSINHQSNPNFLSQQCLNEKAWLFRKWYIFDKLFFKPLLTNSSPTLIDTFPSMFLPLTRLLTTNEQLNNALNSTYSDATSACGFNNVNFTGVASDSDLVDHQERNSNYQRYSFENNSNFEASYLNFGLSDNRQQLNEILESTLERSVDQLVQSNGDANQQIIFDRMTHNQSQPTKQAEK